MLCVVVVATVAVIAATRPSGDGDHRPRVILYGDSLSWEARDAFALTLGDRVRLVRRVYPGTAICDWLPKMRADVKDPPDVAVLEFVGNDVTPCIHRAGQALTGPALVARYVQDADTATRILTSVGTQVIWVLGPLANTPGALAGEDFRDLYRDQVVPGNTGLPAISGMVRFVDAGRAVLGASGEYVTQLPCLPTEGAAQGCRDGMIRVRADDGVHFCPTANPLHGACPVYSSGALRFGRAMAEPVRRALHL